MNYKWAAPVVLLVALSGLIAVVLLRDSGHQKINMVNTDDQNSNHLFEVVLANRRVLSRGKKKRGITNTYKPVNTDKKESTSTKVFASLDKFNTVADALINV